jgi:hypothetical protein
LRPKSQIFIIPAFNAAHRTQFPPPIASYLAAIAKNHPNPIKQKPPSDNP